MSSAWGGVLFSAAIKRGRASNNQFSVVNSNGRLVDDPGGYVAADGRRQPLDPRRRCRLSDVFSLFPTLTAVVSLYGLVADPGMVGRQISAVQGVLPPEAVKLVATWLQALVHGPTARFGIGLIVSVVLAVGRCAGNRRPGLAAAVRRAGW